MTRLKSPGLLAACALLAGVPDTAFAQAEPYRTSDTSVAIVWLTDTPNHSKVRYGRGPA